MHTTPEDAEPTDLDTNMVDGLVQTMSRLARAELREFGSPAFARLGTDAEFELRLPANLVVFSDLIRLCLLLAAEAVDLGRSDKTEWDIQFSFRGYSCSMRNVKAGLKLVIRAPSDDPESLEMLSQTMVRQLVKAAKNVKRHVVDVAVEDKLAKNNATVLNQHVRYSGMVNYFRNGLDRHRASADAEEYPNATPTGDASDANPGQMLADLVFGGVMKDARRDNEAAYLATALVSGYFALVQHRLVLLAGFSPAALHPMFNLRDNLGAAWADQFTAAIPAPRRGDDEKARTDLLHLARSYRNPLMHAGGHPADGIEVEWAPGQHIMLDDGNEPTDKFMLWKPSLSGEDLDDLLATIDRIEAWFGELPYFAWIAAGMAVSFDRQSVEHALEHRRLSTIAEFVAATEEASDRASNWEF